jgi:capsular polysaccharide biosynthesis protein
VKDLILRLREEEPVWGHLPAQMRFKQELVRQVGLLRAFNVAASTLPVPHLQRLGKRRIRSLGETARCEALDFRELWGGGEAFEAPPPRILGPNDHGPFRGISRSAYLACFANCLVRGRSAVVLREDAALVDVEGEEGRHLPDNPAYDPGILHATRQHFWTMEPSAETPLLEVEEAFLLSGSHSLDFGHWMTEYLPKLAIARLAGLPPMPVLIDERIPRTHRQSLDLFLPERTDTITIPHLAPVKVRRLWVASNPMFMGFYPTTWDAMAWEASATHPGNFARLYEELGRCLERQGLACPGAKRVYLARKGSRRKKLLHNHAEIENLASSAGFHRIHPEDLPFVEQVAHSIHATHLLGPEGSGMMLGFFARPGTRQAVLSSPHTYPLADLHGIQQGLGIHYTVVTGPFIGEQDPDWLFWTDYRIDPEVFSAFLHDWAAPS